MTDKFELDKKFQSLPEHAQVCASEALRNVLSSQGVDADACYSENIGRCIKKAFIALFEVDSSESLLLGAHHAAMRNDLAALKMIGRDGGAK